MRISNPSARPPRRRAFVGTILAVLVATAGCDKDTPTAGATSTPPASASASSTPSAPPATAGASDYCALATKILIESGLMVNGRIISAHEETMDNLKAMVNLTLPVKDQLLSLVPANIRPAMMVTLQYFQALKDSDFSTSTPVPAGFVAANKAVNNYGEAACGFSFRP